MLCRFRFALEKEKGNMNLQGQDKIAKMTYCNHSIFMLVYLYHLCSNKKMQHFLTKYKLTRSNFIFNTSKVNKEIGTNTIDG